MKKLIAAALSLTLLGVYAVLPVHAAEKQTETISYTYDAGRWTTQHREMEKLGRGLIAIKSGSGVYLSWRLLDSEDHRFGSAESNVSFNVYRNGGSTPIATVTNKTNFTDNTVGTSYSVEPVGGDRCAEVSVQNGKYFDIDLSGNKPADASLPRIISLKVWDGSKYKGYNYIASKSAPQGDTSSYIAAENPTFYVDDFHSEDTAYTNYPYTINDCSVADLDGDGEYEIIVKWDCNGQDNSQGGVTGDVLIDAYKMNGTKLWRVNLGKNIRAGAHYTQFLVYDFDLDGKAEMICKTAPGSKGNDDNYVTKTSSVAAIKAFTDKDNEADYRNGSGYVLDGDEFLTVFDGETGNAVDTIYYPNQRVAPIVWGDTYGGRVDRFTATVAYMDGVNPYAVYMRGYYMRQSGGISEREAACAVSYKNKLLSCTHSFDTYDVTSYNAKSSSASYDSNGNYKGVNGYKSGYEIFAGEGNHNCSTADVDNDGKDEVITGANCYEFTNDNSEMVPKWSTFMEHGDALHIGDYDPTHEGFEFFTVHEDSGPNKFTGTKIGYGMSVIDPAVNLTDPDDTDTWNKLVMFHEEAGGDTGRGVMANIGMGGYYQFWSSGNELQISNGGTSFTQGSKSGLSQNFRIFWDGDLYDELLDGLGTRNGQAAITSWNDSGMQRIFTSEDCAMANDTKNNPALTADLFGDWREELVMRKSDNSGLRVYSTTTPTDYKIKTLMHDPVYRMGVSAEQTAYNQPPHVGLYLADEVFEAKVTGIKITHNPSKDTYVIGESLDPTGLVVTATRDDGTSSPTTLYTLSELDSSTPGEKTITVTCEGFTDTFKVTVLSVNGITVTPPSKTTYSVGQALSTKGMTVTATYSNGKTGEVPVSECEISGFNSSELGECTVTVSYMGKEATFKVNIIEGRITLINGTYETSGSEDDNFDIGSYKDSFTLEHNVTINQLPADGDSNKGSTTGFFFRINPASGTGTGAGWYFTASGSNAANVYWKSGATRNNATKINSTPLSVRQRYTFRYSFSEVGTGSGAKVTLTILDSNGNIVGSASNLNLRNLTNDEQKVLPVGSIQIYNQANAGSTASVTIDNARIYDTGSIYLVSRDRIAYSLNGIGNARMFAAKYSGGALTAIQEIPLTALGESIGAEVDFEPDKVFMWTYDMHPIDVWEKTN